MLFAYQVCSVIYLCIDLFNRCISKCSRNFGGRESENNLCFDDKCDEALNYYYEWIDLPLWLEVLAILEDTIMNKIYVLILNMGSLYNFWNIIMKTIASARKHLNTSQL